MSAKIMAHMVAGYPNVDISLETARGLISGGASYLEIQFPFSDPSADGPAIQAACTTALDQGFKIASGWELIDKIHHEFPQTSLFIMSYASVVYTPGVENFVKAAAQHQISGLIIPDLAPGCDEGLYAFGVKYKVPIIPVIVPSVTDHRLKEILNLKPDWIYVAIRSGITGIHTEISPEIAAFLSSMKDKTKVLAGFGIDSAVQVQALQNHTHALVVGSAFVRTVSKDYEQTKGKNIRQLLENQVKTLIQ